MAIVYDKDGRPVKCGDEDAKILIKSGHYTGKKPQSDKPEKTGK